MYFFVSKPLNTFRQRSVRISYSPLKKALEEFTPGPGRGGEWNQCYYVTPGPSKTNPQLVAESIRKFGRAYVKIQ